MRSRIFRLAVLGAGLPTSNAAFLAGSSDRPNPTLHLPTLEVEVAWDLSAFPKSQTLVNSGFQSIVDLKDVHLPVVCDGSGYGYYELHLHEDCEFAYFAQSDEDMRNFKRMFRLTHSDPHPLNIRDGYQKLCLLKAVPKGTPDAIPEAYQRWRDWRKQTKEEFYHHRICQESFVVSLLKQKKSHLKIAAEMAKIDRMSDKEVYKAIVVGPVPYYRPGDCPGPLLFTPQYLGREAPMYLLEDSVVTEDENSVVMADEDYYDR